MIATILIAAYLNLFGGVFNQVNSICNEYVKQVSYEQEPIVAVKISSAEIFENNYEASLKALPLSESEKEINLKIHNIRISDTSIEDKVCKIAELIAEEGNITYEMGSNLFSWDNKITNTDLLTPGVYYVDNMVMDCSSFVQYVVWISTIEDNGFSRENGILLGRATYFQTLEGNSIDEKEYGCLCYRYNGGSGIIRTGETLGVGETATEEANHVAIYIGDNKYVDCSAGYGGVRIIDATQNPFYNDFFTYFRKIPKEPYESQLEIDYMNENQK